MDRKLTQDIENRRAERRDLVKNADRSEKIRTYNYAQVCVRIRVSLTLLTRTLSQERVTDHRLGHSLMNLSSVMEEDGLHEFIDAMKRDHGERVMEEMIRDS